MHLKVPSPSHIHCQVDFDRIFFPFFKFMALHVAMFYRPQAAQMNEKSPQKSSLDFTLTQHPCDENFELQEMRLHLKIEPLQTWYY
jgi:hypothetical protein